ncbi:MAG: hypothetical protein V4447_11290 [Pseudomonadota bacterium]
MITAIFTTVLAALCVAGILAILKSRWLYVIAPKLYLNTPISDGQIVSLTIFNAGLIAEEDVAISIRPGCKFELIATSKSTLTVTGKTLSIPKLSRLETITVLLLIEGKTFDPSDIDSIESKATKGKVVESKEKASAAWQPFVILPIMLLFLVVPFVFGTVMGAEMKMSVIRYASDKLELFGNSKQLAGYKNTLREINGDGVLKDAIKESRLLMEAQEVIRRDDILTVTLKIINKTKIPLMSEGYLKSSAGDKGSLDFWDSRAESFAIAPNETKLVKMKVFLPESLSVKIVESRFTFESTAGDALHTAQTLEFN